MTKRKTNTARDTLGDRTGDPATNNYENIEQHDEENNNGLADTKGSHKHHRQESVKQERSARDWSKSLLMPGGVKNESEWRNRTLMEKFHDVQAVMGLTSRDIFETTTVKEWTGNMIFDKKSGKKIKEMREKTVFKRSDWEISKMLAIKNKAQGTIAGSKFVKALGESISSGYSQGQSALHKMGNW